VQVKKCYMGDLALHGCVAIPLVQEIILHLRHFAFTMYRCSSSYVALLWPSMVGATYRCWKSNRRVETARPASCRVVVSVALLCWIVPAGIQLEAETVPRTTGTARRLGDDPSWERVDVTPRDNSISEGRPAAFPGSDRNVRETKDFLIVYTQS
jgi:hypothetical protein